jgi:DNA-directed RNA polymerase specialized sigma24 family protein
VDRAELEFREFFAAGYGRLRGPGFLLTSDWAQAEELAQDALVRTYRAWPRVRRSGRPGAYARKVLVNRHRSLLRRAAVEASHLAGRRPRRPSSPTWAPTGWRCGRRSGACPPASGPCWSSATTRICRRRRWPGCSACPRAR